MPKSKKLKTRTGETSSSSTPPAMTATLDCDSITIDTTSHSSFQYGHLLVALMLDAVSPSDLIPLRCVNRHTRDFIDQLVTGTNQRLPVSVVERWLYRGLNAFIEYATKYTTVLDLESVDRPIVALLQSRMQAQAPSSKLEVLRLVSDERGLQTYSVSQSLGAATMVVFPSFNPCLTGRPFTSFERRDVPYDVLVPFGVEKLVQHISFAVDWRGPVLLRFDPRQRNSVKNEVWIMTHAVLKVEFLTHFGRSISDLHSWKSERQDDFLWEMSTRLKHGVILTLVGLELVDTNELLGMGEPVGPELEYEIRSILQEVDEVSDSEIRNIHFVTWDEYTATLSPEQLEIESLPPGYLERWSSILAKMYPANPLRTVGLVLRVMAEEQAM